MNYKELLGGYVTLPIKIEEIRFLLKENTGLMSLNPKLFSLLNSYKIYNSNDFLSEINITANGIKINLYKLKKALLIYYGIEESENPTASLVKLEQDIKSKIITSPNLSSLMLADFAKYQLPRYLNPTNNPKKKNKGKTKSFMKHTRRSIRSFIDLLTNYEQYTIVSDVFDEDKLKLYLAYKIMLYARQCEKNRDTVNNEHALNYIREFLAKNPTIVDNNLTIHFGKRLARKEYSIQELVRFVSARLPKKTKENASIDTYSYSFFECDKEKIQEVFTSATRAILTTDNSEELRALLSRKLSLYESLNIIKVKIGADSFDGYIGMVLDNGKVILDKFFDDRKTGKIATDNAIYIINEEDFEKVTRMSKSETIEAINKGLISAVRFFHSGDYERRVKNILTRKKEMPQ